MTPCHLEKCFEALDANGLLRHTHLLTGYTPGAEALEIVRRIVTRLRQLNPALIYVLDPVMGDNNCLYVHESVPPLYRSLLPMATIATPNDFEASLLTNSPPLTSVSSISACLSAFHRLYNLPHIIISSVSLPHSELSALPGPVPVNDLPLPNTEGKVLLCAGSSKNSEAWVIPFPCLAEHYEGVGDLFSSLVLSRFSSSSNPLDLRETAELAIASLQGVLAATRKAAIERFGEDVGVRREGETLDERVARLRAVELKIVTREGREAIERPVVRWKAVTL